MSGCHNPETLELCKHLQPIKFGCNQCNDGYKKASPMVEQMQRLEERLNFLEKENKMRQETIGCLDSAYNDAFLEVEKHLNKMEKTINENYSNCAIRDSKSKDRIKELEDYIETGKLHNDWRHKILDMEKTISELVDKIAEMANFYYQEKKTPFRCPLCEGKVLTEVKIKKTESGNDKLIIECHACDGNGIVWG